MRRLKLRPSVQWFAEQMERKLRENDRKGGWLGPEFSVFLAIGRVLDESKELREAYFPYSRQRTDGLARDAVVREACDVANFAMMAADRARRGLW